MKFPLMVRVRQKLKESPLVGAESELLSGLERVYRKHAFSKAKSAAIAVGSRRIDRIAEIVRNIGMYLSNRGIKPFIVPAMGSHGGASAEGQVRILESIGITEESTGIPIVSSMETVRIGDTESGVPVFMDERALSADMIIVVNRVAPHTGFSGSVQSGIQKMIAVGLGNEDGARALHSRGFENSYLISEMASLVIEKTHPCFAVALVEDGRKMLSHLEVMTSDEIAKREPPLLEMAFSLYPSLPLDYADILIIDEIGKDHSGVGMDPMITGRGKKEERRKSTFKAKRIVALGLSRASCGNATGVGHADIITEELFHSINFESTYRNVFSSGALERAKIPIVAKSDREAIRFAIESLGKDGREARVIRIKNTSEVSEIEVSENTARNLLGEDLSILGEAKGMDFDLNGRLRDRFL